MSYLFSKEAVEATKMTQEAKDKVKEKFKECFDFGLDTLRHDYHLYGLKADRLFEEWYKENVIEST